MPMTFISSDWHLDHPNVLKYNSRPFKDLDEQLAYFIKEIQQLPPGSRLILLGDILVYGNKAKAREILEKFPRHVNYLIVVGNHDRGLMSLYKELGICVEYIEIRYADQKLVLSHYPMLEWNRGQYGSIHLFGHCHGQFIHPGRAIDVGWDAHQKLLDLDWVVKTLLQKPIFQPCHSKNNGLVLAPDTRPVQNEKS